jgi:ribosomal-protein-alanine N-acetyltransferase
VVDTVALTMALAATDQESTALVETERLILRQLQLQDADAMFEMDSDPEVHKYIDNNPLTHVDQCLPHIRSIQRQYQETGMGRLAVVLKETSEFIGWAGIKVEHNVHGHDTFHDLGYRFLRKHWGKGYATEACQGLVGYGFQTLHLNVLCGVVFVTHEPSCKVLEKCGFKKVGEPFFEDGGDNWWYELHRDDYRSSRQPK